MLLKYKYDDLKLAVPVETILKELVESKDLNILILDSLKNYQFCLELCKAARLYENIFGRKVHILFLTDDKEDKRQLYSLLDVNSNIQHVFCNEPSELISYFLGSDILLLEDSIKEYIDIAKIFKLPVLIASKKGALLLSAMISKVPQESMSLCACFKTLI